MKIANFFTLLFAACAPLSPTAAFPAMPWHAMQTVDLRSFFHGDEQPSPKAPPPKQLAIVSTATGVVPDAEIESFLRAFADAIKARDGKPMLSRLSGKYAIDDLPDDKKPGDLFTQAIERIPGAAGITIKSVEKQNGVRTAKIEFRYNADIVKLKTFRFDADTRLLWSDLFALQRRQHGA